MAIQIVMDHTGDTRHPFSPDDAQALAKAEERFKKLTGLGFTAGPPMPLQSVTEMVGRWNELDAVGDGAFSFTIA